MFKPEGEMDFLIGLLITIIYLFSLLIRYLVRKDKSSPTGFKLYAFWMFVLLYGAIGPLFLYSIKTIKITVLSEEKPGVVKPVRYAGFGDITEVEGVRIDVSVPGPYYNYIVNKTPYPVTITEVYYDDARLIADSTRVYTLDNGSVFAVDKYPRFWNRPAPDTHYVGTGRDRHKAHGHFYVVEIPGVKILN